MSDRLKILDIWVDPVDRGEAVARARSFLRNDARPHSIFAANPEKNYSVPRDPVLYETYKNADLLLPDGIGMVIAARLLSGCTIERVPGSEFIFDLCRLAVAEDCGLFVYGSTEPVNRKAVELLEERFPGLKISGRSNGYISKEDMPELIERINASGAKILFIALGSPSQERWFATYKESLQHVRIVQGVGGTLDTIAGTVKRAPQIWRRYSAEWLYRLITQPSRIKRQKVLPLFAAAVCAAKLKLLLARGCR